VGIERGFLPSAVIALRPPRTTSEDPFTNALFPSAPTPTNQSYGGDELIPGPAVPVESLDLRGALQEMAAAQRTGHWISAYVPDDGFGASPKIMTSPKDSG
jgi:hypothetical protein